MAFDLYDSLSFLLVQVSKAHRQTVASALERLGLHVGQEMLLKYLAREDGVSQSELAARMEVEPPTVTKMLSRMEGTGLLERRRDPSDARVYRVYLTEQGRAALTAIDQIWQEIETAMVAGLSLEERLLLRRLLLAMRSNLG